MTHHIAAMIDTHPRAATTTNADKLAACIAACFECAATCTACADACLGEDTVSGLTKCIRLNADCADICAATGAVLSRQTERDAGVVRALLEACRAACKACGDECAGHAEMHEHCRVCADACRRCEEACAELQALLP